MSPIEIKSTRIPDSNESHFDHYEEVRLCFTFISSGYDNNNIESSSPPEQKMHFLKCSALTIVSALWYRAKKQMNDLWDRSTLTMHQHKITICEFYISWSSDCKPNNSERLNPL